MKTVVPVLPPGPMATHYATDARVTAVCQLRTQKPDYAQLHLPTATAACKALAPYI